MARFGAGIGRSVVAAAAMWWLVSRGPARGQGSDFWDRPPGGFWELGANWADGSAPGTTDTATFNVAGAYLVEFGTVPTAIRKLSLTAGDVTFNSGASATPRTLNVNSTLFGGPQDVNITSGATLSLGTIVGFVINPLHLTVGHELMVNSGSTLNVRFGSDVITSTLTSNGQVNVSGFGSALTAGLTAINGGSMNVTAGGVVQSDDAFIDSNSMGIVSDAGSQWIITDTIRVGKSGAGTLNITAGGNAQSLFGLIGDLHTAVGVVTVSGAGSRWNNSSNLNVGDGGSGTLNVTGGGSVSSAEGFIGKKNGSDGTATITGGAWTMTGRLSVGGNADASSVGGPGTLNIQPAGTVSAAQGVVLFPDAHVNLQGGTLDASAISYHQGIQGDQFQWTSGTLHVGTFNGSLTNSGGALAPGHSAGSTTINGNFTQVTEGVLEIEIGGSLAGSQFDFVSVTGSAQVGGELDLTLTGGFLPTAGQTFAILISNNLSGAFDNAPSGQRVTTTNGGGSFLINYGFGSPFDDNQVILSAFLPSISGDFDHDGDVDGADFLKWQRGGSPTPNSAADLAAWRGNFGFGGLTAAATSIPEPRADLLAVSLTVFALLYQRKRS